MTVFALALDDALQPLPFFFGSNLARHAGVIHRRHVDQEATGQRDVAGDASALLADRFFGDLHQDFLPFLEQVGDQRHALLLVAPETASTAATASATLRPAIVSRTRRPLGIASRARRSADLGPSLGHSGSAGFGGKRGFRLGLGFIELGFDFGFFVDFFRRSYVNFFRGNRLGRKGHSIDRCNLGRGCNVLRGVMVLISDLFSGGVGLFLKLLEGCILLEVLDVMSQIRLFFFDLFFLDRSGKSNGRGGARMLEL